MTKRGAGGNPFEKDAVASVYDNWYDTPGGREVDRLEKALIFRLAQPRPGESALDVGTGTGNFACDLANRGLRVTGYDSSGAMLQIARGKDANVTWQQGRAEALPFGEGSFDLVLSVTSVEFMQEPDLALAEMFRVVAPGGRMVVAVLNARSLWGRARICQASQQDTPFRHAHLYTAAEFVAALRRYGRPKWSGSVFFAHSGRGMRVADLLERLGQRLCPGRGALLVGRVDK